MIEFINEIVGASGSKPHIFSIELTSKTAFNTVIGTQTNPSIITARIIPNEISDHLDYHVKRMHRVAIPIHNITMIRHDRCIPEDWED